MRADGSTSLTVTGRVVPTLCTPYRLRMNLRQDPSQEEPDAAKPKLERGITPERWAESEEGERRLDRLAEGHREKPDHGPLRPTDSREALEDQDRRIEEQAATR